MPHFQTSSTCWSYMYQYLEYVDLLVTLDLLTH